MARMRVLLVHGAATTPTMWDRLIPVLSRGARTHDLAPIEIVAPHRPSSGDLATEVAALAPLARGAVVVGASGGATLGLALLASDVPLAGAVLHEPAAGSLVPGLLAPMAEAYAHGGVEAFARKLYGPTWIPSMAPEDPGAVARDLAMFRAFEPQAASAGQGPAITTVGSDSPAIRHQAARALEGRFGLPARVIPMAEHFVAWDRPEGLAEMVLAMVRSAGG